MPYDTWVIGGITPNWIVDVDPAPNNVNRRITLHCYADSQVDLNGADPRSEIEQFEAMLCDSVTNTPLLQGGSKLQVKNGEVITVTDGITTWNRAAIAEVNYNPDLMSQVRMPYDIVLELETTGAGGSVVYVPDYDDYSNIDYYFFYTAGPPEDFDTYDGNPLVKGTELGWMEITEPQNVSRVEIYGCGDELPCYAEVNGVKQYWTYGEAEDGVGVPRLEKLIWILDTPTDTIVINSSEHWEEVNHGFYADYIRLTYE